MQDIIKATTLIKWTLQPRSIQILCALLFHLQNNALILLLEPGDRILLGDSVLGADSSRSDLSSRNSVSRSDHDNVEIHTENASGRVVLQTQIDVLSDTEAEASSAGEVLLLQLVLLNLQATVKDFVGLESTNLQCTKQL